MPTKFGSLSMDTDVENEMKRKKRMILSFKTASDPDEGHLNEGHGKEKGRMDCPVSFFSAPSSRF